MDTFVERMSELAPDQVRILLVANNPELKHIDFHTLGINKDDVIIQFNMCIHFDKISDYRSKKVFIFSHNHLNSAFGFSELGEPEDNVKKVFEFCEDIDQIFFTYHFPEKIQNAIAHFSLKRPPIIFRDSDVSDFKYPKSMIPSVGFLTFSALFNSVVQRCGAASKRPIIYCIGFNGRIYRDHEEVFHDFIYERHIITRSDAILHRCFT